MDQVQTINHDIIEIYKNEIELEIALQLEKLNISEPDKITHSQFNYILSKVGKTVFKDRSKLKINNNTNNSNYYNFDILNNLYNIYIDYCYIYNKVPSIDSFSLLCNIDTNVFNNMKYEKTNSIQYAFYEKMTRNREAALKNKCLDSNNILGTITIGNTELNWNNNAGSVQHITNNIITSDALPLLQASKNNAIAKND